MKPWTPVFIAAILFLFPISGQGQEPSDRMGNVPRVTLAQAMPIAPADKKFPEKQGCRTVDVRCVCENPTRDFVVKNQKIGRVNPGEAGECRSKTYIDEAAKTQPLSFCLKGDDVKDVRQGASKCTATWTCVEPCQITETIK